MDPKASSMENCNIQTAPFLKQLPIEIRTEVYRNLLSTQYTKHLSVSRQLPIHAKLWPGHAYHLEPAILQTSRQVHNEASTVLYHENLFVRVRSTKKNLGRLMNLKGIHVFLEGRKAETFKHCAMSVNFDRLNTALRIKSQEDEPCYVIASTDLQLLCQSLLIQHTVIGSVFKHYEFRVTIHRMCDDMLSKTPAQTSSQRRLLEPFTVLHGVSHFAITGPANTEYCASIIEQVSRMAPAVEECFSSAIELRDKGHEYVLQNDLEGAVKVYELAFSQLITTCLRCRLAGTEWLALHPELPGAIVDTYLTLVVRLAFTSYRLDAFEDVHLWACDATRFDPNGRAMGRENSYAKLVYLKATASARLGRHPQAVEELCEGLKLVTKEAYRDKQLLAMRREMRYQIKGLGGIRLLKAMGIGHL